ncbi:MAG: hypothetical protein ACJAYU_000608 [Bradymonadia bacterium]|jgi:hypothetical protein
MVLYDVILAGFPEGPKIGTSEAQALSSVFGIPRHVAERMVAKVPAIVKSGVTEEVCRKYYNAFAYIGAKCEFLVTDENSGAEGDGVGDRSEREELIRPMTVSKEETSRLQLTPTASFVMTPPPPGTATILEDVRETGDLVSTGISTPKSRTLEPPSPHYREPATRLSAPDIRVPASEGSSAPPRAIADGESGVSVRFDARVLPLASRTARSLPNPSLHATLHDRPDSLEVSVCDAGRPPMPRIPDSQPTVDRPFSGIFPTEMTPPEINWIPMELGKPRTELTASKLVAKSAPPKASILDEKPSINGARPDLVDSLGSDNRLRLDSADWPSGSDPASLNFLRDNEQTGGSDEAAGTRIPQDSTAEVIVEPMSQGTAPSVAEIKAAWKAGKDISLGPGLNEGDDPPSLGDWDPWLDSELPDADFPSGVAVSESRDQSSTDSNPGNQLEAPATSRIMAQLGAQKRAHPRLESDSGPVPLAETPAALLVTPTKPSDPNVPLFGSPLGARMISGSGMAPRTADEIPAKEQQRNRPVSPRGEPTEVPMAAMNFVRRRRKN